MRYAIRWFKCKLKPPKKIVNLTIIREVMAKNAILYIFSRDVVFKWGNVWVKSHEISWYVWYLGISSIPIGWNGSSHDFWRRFWGLGITWGHHGDGTLTTWKWHRENNGDDVVDDIKDNMGWYWGQHRDDIGDMGMTLGTTSTTGLYKGYWIPC